MGIKKKKKRNILIYLYIQILELTQQNSGCGPQCLERMVAGVDIIPRELWPLNFNLTLQKGPEERVST